MARSSNTWRTYCSTGRIRTRQLGAWPFCLRPLARSDGADERLDLDRLRLPFTRFAPRCPFLLVQQRGAVSEHRCSLLSDRLCRAVICDVAPTVPRFCHRGHARAPVAFRIRHSGLLFTMLLPFALFAIWRWTEIGSRGHLNARQRGSDRGPGLACAVEQIVWLIALFLVIGVWRNQVVRTWGHDACE